MGAPSKQRFGRWCKQPLLRAVGIAGPLILVALGPRSAAAGKDAAADRRQELQEAYRSWAEVFGQKPDAARVRALEEGRSHAESAILAWPANDEPLAITDPCSGQRMTNRSVRTEATAVYQYMTRELGRRADDVELLRLGLADGNICAWIRCGALTDKEARRFFAQDCDRSFDEVVGQLGEISPVLLATLTPELVFAAERGQLERVENLLAKGERPDQRDPIEGETALAAAAGKGHVKIVKALLDAGADANMLRLPHRSTALHAAAWSGQVEIAGLLLARRADPNARDINGTTPLALASQRRQEAVAALLRKAGGAQ